MFIELDRMYFRHGRCPSIAAKCAFKRTLHNLIVFVLIDPTAKEIKKKYQVCFRHYHIHLVCQGQSLRTEDIQVSIDITKNKLDILYLCYRIF